MQLYHLRPAISSSGIGRGDRDVVDLPRSEKWPVDIHGMHEVNRFTRCFDTRPNAMMEAFPIRLFRLFDKERAVRQDLGIQEA